MSWRLASALVQLREERDDRWPNCDKRSDGTIGDRAHSNRTSAHNPNEHGVVLAFDVTAPHGHDIAEMVRLSRDRRVRLCISQGRIWSHYDHAAGPAYEWRPYSGSNPHDKHAHVELLDNPKLYDDTSQWFNDEKEPDMSDAWLKRWPESLRTWARGAKDKGLLTVHTDPTRKLSDVTLGELLVFLDRDKG